MEVLNLQEMKVVTADDPNRLPDVDLDVFCGLLNESVAQVVSVPYDDPRDPMWRRRIFRLATVEVGDEVEHQVIGWLDGLGEWVINPLSWDGPADEDVSVAYRTK